MNIKTTTKFDCLYDVQPSNSSGVFLQPWGASFPQDIRYYNFILIILASLHDNDDGRVR